jgi:hypothetical protein
MSPVPPREPAASLIAVKTSRGADRLGSYTVSMVTFGLEPGVAMRWRFVLVASLPLLACGGSEQPARPAAPSGVTVVAGNGQATVHWGEVAGATSYACYWKTSPGVTRVDSRLSATQGPLVHSGLTNGQTYYYVVSAQSPNGESDLSAEVSAAPVAPRLDAPQVTAVNGILQVTLTWNGVPGATSYAVYWKTTAGVTAADTRLTATGSPFVHGGLTGGQAYHYAVAAVGPDGEGYLSAEVVATPQPALPASPLLAAAPGDRQVTLTWSGVEGATSYNLYWKTTAGVTTSDNRLSAVTSPFAHGSLTNGTSYHYVLSAMGPSGESVPSPEVAATPRAPGPATLTATPGRQQVAVSWSEVAGATSYNLHWSSTPGESPTSGARLEGVSAPYHHTNLLPGSYRYAVTALTPGGETAPSPEASGPIHPIAFVSSVTGTGDLSRWADAGGKTGLAAADSVCQARASAVGLVGTFRAWLSDSRDDALCRMNGATGRWSQSCGLPARPSAAGPWVRIDGYPFAEITDATAGRVTALVPLRYDETGAAVPAPFTSGATSFMGGGTSCGDWTSSAAAYVGIGYAEQASSGWAGGASASVCDTAQHLTCAQMGAGPPLVKPAAQGKKVFITVSYGTGDLGSWPEAGGQVGLAAGDAICQARAVHAGLANAGRFKAWLSDAATNAADRITSNGTWVRLAGIPVATSKADLLDGSLFTAIAVTDAGIDALWYDAWTGTNGTGAKTAQHCQGWTSASSTERVTVGRAPSASSTWTVSGTAYCSYNNMHLYCFED